jgi:aminoglycoside 6'-N-acetyltransferase I
MTGDVLIRALQAADEAEWLRLRHALWPDDELEELQREMAEIRADPQQPVFVAERPGGGLCGLLEVSIRRTAPGCKTDRIGYLEGWYVDPDRRQRGVGGRLVAAAEAWARAQGCSEMASDTTPEYPVSPQAHEALGYRETERYFRKDLG